MPNPPRFTCAACGLEFKTDPDFPMEDRIAEFEATHNKPFPGDDYVGQVCDSCYPNVLAFARELGLLPPEEVGS